MNSEEATEFVRFVNRLEDEIADARREADQLRAALRDIETYTSSENTDDPFGQFAITRMQNIARAALAGVQAKEHA